MNVVEYNRTAWNNEARSGSRWSQPVSPEVIARAKSGDWGVILTPNKVVPKEWFGEIKGKPILCLASGGGQQVPILAAAGAKVVSFDNSDEQLARDRMVADRDSLEIQTIRGDMADLSALEDRSFNLIFHPCSNGYVQKLQPVWQECFRVLKPGGHLLAGFINPVLYLFDEVEAEQTGILQVRYPLPYSDLIHLPKERLREMKKKQDPVAFGHTLEEQLGGQMKAGFVITDLYEDDWDDGVTPLNRYCSTFIATRAQRLPQ